MIWVLAIDLVAGLSVGLIQSRKWAFPAFGLMAAWPLLLFLSWSYGTGCLTAPVYDERCDLAAALALFLLGAPARLLVVSLGTLASQRLFARPQTDGE